MSNQLIIAKIKTSWVLLLALSTWTMAAIPLVASGKEITTFSQIQRLIIDSIKRRNTESYLRSFVQATHPGRMVGSSGHKKAFSYLKKSIRELGGQNSLKRQVQVAGQQFVPEVNWAISLYQQDFERKIKTKFSPNSREYQKWLRFTQQRIKILDSLKGVTGRNLVWEKLGRRYPQEVLLIGAHYDSLVSDPKTLLIKADEMMPGADDNASGVSTLLALIKLLAPLELPRTVRIIFFDFQELGFLGSRAYVEANKQQWKKEKIFGMLNLEMLGHDTKLDDTSKQLGNMRAYIRSPGDADGFKQDRILANQILTAGAKQGSGVSFDLIPNGFDSSDHLPFWSAGLPAMFFTQNWEEDFNHRGFNSSNDFSETINFVTLHHSAQFIAAGVLSWAFGI
ncbi:MAG: M28 family peptidase [Bdellovibrionales bacterium]|jgi:hypothetical protein|nr:M28 family peptidase [Bdellovibrionales bacterium]MBT3525170.1 M28 family peptidase [Bdellovibrionales bacterium]MBT7669492.1 M28 family peptidase [Bdellovibrionales bacterium]MBT7766078.1 M28 family peptidase [Bdellovibrionales bacterium]